MNQNFDERILNGMSILAAMVQCGSFAGAGKALNMSQSGVSRSIARLEARLGIRLLERTTRIIVSDIITMHSLCLAGYGIVQVMENAVSRLLRQGKLIDLSPTGRMSASLSTPSTHRGSICQPRPAHFWISLSHYLRPVLPMSRIS